MKAATRESREKRIIRGIASVLAVSIGFLVPMAAPQSDKYPKMAPLDLSKSAYLYDDGDHNGPHVMFFAALKDGKDWGADASGSPVFAGPYWFLSPEEPSQAKGLPPILVLPSQLQTGPTEPPHPCSKTRWNARPSRHSPSSRCRGARGGALRPTRPAVSARATKRNTPIYFDSSPACPLIPSSVSPAASGRKHNRVASFSSHWYSSVNGKSLA